MNIIHTTYYIHNIDNIPIICTYIFLYDLHWLFFNSTLGNSTHQAAGGNTISATQGIGGKPVEGFRTCQVYDVRCGQLQFLKK